MVRLAEAHAGGFLAHPQDPRGHAGHHRVGRHVARDHGVRADHGVVADRHAAEDAGAVADPDVVARRARRACRCPAAGSAGPPRPSPWSKSISITRSAITHSRPIDTCWYAEIVHSCPITVFAPIETVPSWLRILHAVPEPRPAAELERGPRAHLEAAPGTDEGEPVEPAGGRAGGASARPSRSDQPPYLGFSIPWRRMKRSRVGSPPRLGGGGPRSEPPCDRGS